MRDVEGRNVTFLSSEFPVFWESAQGSWVRDVDGNRYLDLTSAFGVASLGHRAAEIERTIAAQSARLWHAMGDVHPTVSKVELLEALARITPGDLQFSILSSSGAEAVESALKTAMLATGKPGVVAFEGGYHGLTYGALRATHRPDFRGAFLDDWPETVAHLPFPDSLRGPSDDECVDAFSVFCKSERGKRTGAVIVEPIQGRGGVRVPGPQFLRGVAEVARENGALLVADEIFTGFGRTGKRFAVEHAGVVPELMCLGKAMANGFPISACIGTPRAMNAWPLSTGEAIHTSTFLGQPLGCAMALRSIQELEAQELAKRAADLGRKWKARLAEVLGGRACVGEIRGEGLMIGIELVRDRASIEPDARKAAEVVTRALAKGVIVLSSGNARNVLSLTPPLTVLEGELEMATKILAELI